MLMRIVQDEKPGFLFSFRNFFFVSLAIQVFLGLLVKPPKLVYLLVAQIFWLTWSCAILYRQDLLVSRLIGISRMRARHFYWLAAYMPILMALFGTIALLALYVTTVHPSFLLQQLSQSISRELDWFTVGINVVVAPFIEELTFRGVLLSGLLVRYGVTKAILFSSLGFAVMHAETLGILPFVLGVLYAIVYLRTGSLAVTICMHSFWNIMANLKYGWMQRETGVPSMHEIQLLSERLHGVAPMAALIMVAGVVMLVLGALRFWPYRYSPPYWQALDRE